MADDTTEAEGPFGSFSQNVLTRILQSGDQAQFAAYEVWKIIGPAMQAEFENASAAMRTRIAQQQSAGPRELIPGGAQTGDTTAAGNNLASGTAAPTLDANKGGTSNATAGATGVATGQQASDASAAGIALSGVSK